MIAILFRAFLFYLFYKFIKTGYHMFKAYKHISQGAHGASQRASDGTMANNNGGDDAIEAEYRRVDSED